MFIYSKVITSFSVPFLVWDFGGYLSINATMWPYLLVHILFFNIDLVSGIGEQIIIKGGAQTLIYQFLNDADSDLILKKMYYSPIKDHKIEIGFLFIIHRQGKQLGLIIH